MKDINNFISEKLVINKNIKIKNPSNKYHFNKLNYKDGIELLKDEAAGYDCKISFKNHPGDNTGDFTIFIYKKGSKKYDVGFDGDWDFNSIDNFNRCLKDAVDWLEKNCK
jgi:hypothetical protein